MTVKTINEDHCWGCHKDMTSAEFAERHTYHDDVCCQDEPVAVEHGEDHCGGLNAHARCCPVCHPEKLTLTGPHDGFYPTAEELKGVPGLYGTERTPLKDQVIHLHYFVGGCDWWLVEYSPTEALGFGYACLGDPACAEWGYVSVADLATAGGDNPWLQVERDLGWRPRKVSEVDLPGR